MQSASGLDSRVEELSRINQALRGWLELLDADRLHLVVDRQASQVRLQHGAAVLRNCPIWTDSLGQDPGQPAELRLHIRRYRPSDPWSPIASGPFDWEQVLAAQASDECALYFSNRLLIYASSAWEPPRVPALRLAPADLRALYQAGAPGLPLVILPFNWNEEW